MPDAKLYPLLPGMPESDDFAEAAGEPSGSTPRQEGH